MNDPVGIEIPFTLLEFALVTFGLFSFSTKQLMFEDNERSWIYFNCIVLLIIISLSMYCSYKKLEVINDHIANHDLVTIVGKVTNLYRSNGGEHFYVENQKFEFDYSGNSYCFNYKNELSDNEFLKITYVDLSKRWLWKKSKKCMLSVQSIAPSNNARVIYDPWHLIQKPEDQN